MFATSPKSFTATISISGLSQAIFKNALPILPKPLMPTLIVFMEINYYINPNDLFSFSIPRIIRPYCLISFSLEFYQKANLILLIYSSQIRLLYSDWGHYSSFPIRLNYYLYI